MATVRPHPSPLKRLEPPRPNTTPAGAISSVSRLTNAVFGGYLMRKALEVGWLSAYKFLRVPPVFAGLDEVVFNKPVEIGTIIELVGRVRRPLRQPRAQRLAHVPCDDVLCSRPDSVVGVGAQAVYASEDCETETVRVFVEAQRLSLASGRREATNVFHFIFRPPEARATSSSTPRPRRAVQPETYEEGMLYLEGRRRWLNSQHGRGGS